MKTFYLLISSLLKKYKKEDIFLRSSQYLGHSYKEIDIVNVEKIDNNIDNVKSLEIMTYFFGLLGSKSPLPNYILDKFSKNYDDNNGFSLFFDFFNNHFLWLLYESFTTRSYPRSFKHSLDDRISEIFLHLLGIHNKDIAKEYLPFASLVANIRKPKLYIEKVLEHNFNLKSKIHIIENVPQKIFIEYKQQQTLGISNNALGKSFILGSYIVSHQNKINILIDDISYQEALDYLPHQVKFNKLKESIIFLTNNEFSVDMILGIQYSKKMHSVLGDPSYAKLGYAKVLGKSLLDSKNYFWRIKLCD